MNGAGAKRKRKCITFSSASAAPGTGSDSANALWRTEKVRRSPVRLAIRKPNKPVT